MSFLGKRKSNRACAYNNSPFKKPRYFPPKPRVRRTTRSLINYRQNFRTGGFLGIETKFLDSAISGIEIPTTFATAVLDPTANSLCAIAQGDGESNRDGRQVTLKSLHVKGNIKHLGTDGSTVRILIVQDTQTNGAQMNGKDLILDTTDTSARPFGFRNLEKVSRFKVLYDQTFSMNQTPLYNGTTILGSSTRFFKTNITLPAVKVNYKATTASVSSITDNSFHILAVSSDVNDALEYNCRVRFMG